MEEEGWVSSTWDKEQAQGPPRRVYRLTASGDETLAVWIQELKESKMRIDKLLNVYHRHMEEGEGDHH
jgi:DNA-binding PadR family transcriptional regulator